MSLGLTIEVDVINDCCILRLTGRIDAITTVELEKALSSLMQEGHFFLLLDFTRIDYLSSAGLRLLLSMQKKTAKEKGSIVLFSLQDDVLDIIKMAGFEKILRIATTEKAALEMKP